jgi:hypothetical protein
MLSRTVAVALIGVAATSLIGCGASTQPHPFSLSQVRGAFAAQNFRPTATFDAATAADADIARLALASIRRLRSLPAHTTG